jgi:hypothetical protein
MLILAAVRSIEQKPVRAGRARQPWEYPRSSAAAHVSPGNRARYAAFITSTAGDGSKGVFATPADDLSIERFAKVLVSHLGAFV